MPARPLLYYITDRAQFSGDETQCRRQLLAKISEATACGVDFIQLREKDLSTLTLEALAREALETIQSRQAESQNPETRLLINSRADVALAVGADGVHLRSHDISAHDARAVYESWATAPQGLNRAPFNRLSGTLRLRSGQAPKAVPSQGAIEKMGKSDLVVPQASSGERNWLVAVSCHSEDEVGRAAAEGADFVVFAPVFEKRGSTPAGIDVLRRACLHNVPVLALGGVTLENAQSCLEAGAAGIAGIRLFQQNEISETVRKIRGFIVRNSSTVARPQEH